MSLIDSLARKELWINFYEQRAMSGHMSFGHEYDFHKFIRNEEYLPVVDKIRRGEPFPNPKKRAIAKSGSPQKRIVYTFPREENYVLKLLTYLLIRKYDAIFPDNLYSFRARHSVKRAIKEIVATPDIGEYYTYKVDISNYFNSINVDCLSKMLHAILHDDTLLYDFLCGLLQNPCSEENGVTIREEKGAMAGTPIAVFFANVYLLELDRQFVSSDIIYYRYSDDIIIFAKSKERIEYGRSLILKQLGNLALAVNHDKEVYTNPHEKWSFLGFGYDNGVVDISDVSIAKLKAKMRRKMRSVLRWKRVRGKSNIKAAKGFINAFNRKFYDTEVASEMNWSRWYFPVITTHRGLTTIDHYMQSCIRHIISEKFTKSNYNFSYEQMKSLGYTPLVHSWYRYRIEGDFSCVPSVDGVGCCASSSRY